MIILASCIFPNKFEIVLVRGNSICWLGTSPAKVKRSRCASIVCPNQNAPEALCRYELNDRLVELYLIYRDILGWDRLSHLVSMMKRSAIQGARRTDIERFIIRARCHAGSGRTLSLSSSRSIERWRRGS